MPKNSLTKVLVMSVNSDDEQVRQSKVSRLGTKGRVVRTDGEHSLVQFRGKKQVWFHASEIAELS